MESVNDIVMAASVIRPLTEINERECVARVAMEVPAGGSIVEIGCLYGGMTAVLGLASPLSSIVTIDDFSWHPEDDVETSPELLLSNMEKIGVSNVEVIKGDSRVIGLTWERPIDLLWIDGGHSYEYVKSDLVLFAKHARVVALHDYGNPFWPTIQKAVEDFLEEYPGVFAVDEVAGTVAVLRRL